ncbi:GNAT family N-acetyltransferase [Halostella litorea]|uniref:GNAT family N-acetyltransferase n=1 Tax=Halostella litorea TaxID=2528831 RepID=UPI001092C1B6|nr:GNAT family N-acetyltransferase [Halostella litorea]
MIRPVSPDDLPALLALQSLLPESSPPLLTTVIDGPGVVLVSVPADPAAAANATATPVGYVLATTGSDPAHVAELVVAPAYRRQGRGRRLLAAALARLRDAGCDVAEIAVEPDNDAARDLYAEFGFEQRERVEDHYDGGGAALLLRRSL